MPQSLDDLAAFVAVARHRSFARAAVERGVSASALSHAVRGLEERLGVRLLNRTTRSMTPTAAGERLLAQLGPALAAVDEALLDLREGRDEPSGPLRLNVSRIAAFLLIAPVLRRFSDLYPAVRLEVWVDDGISDIVRDGFDAGIRLGERLEADMVAVRVGGELRAAVVASPDYLARFGVPGTPRDLARHACIGYRHVTAGTVYRWEFGEGATEVEVAVAGPLTVNDADLAVAAALDGVGLAYVLDPRVLDLVEAGRLVRVLEAWCPPFPGFYLYHPSRRQAPAALRALIGVLRDQLSHSASRSAT